MANLQSVAQELIFRLRVDAAEGKKTFEELKKDVNDFRDAVYKNTNLINGDFDKERELLREINKAFRELQLTIIKEGEPTRNSLKGINREYEFINNSLGQLKQRAEDLKDARLVPEINSQQYKELNAELAKTEAQIKTLENQQKEAVKEIMKGTSETSKYTQALKEADVALREENKTIANVGQALKTTQEAQKQFTAGSNEFQDLSKQYNQLSNALKELQNSAKGASPGSALREDFEATGELAGKSIKDLSLLAKEFKALAESADPTSEAFLEITANLAKVQEELKAQQAALKAATNAQIDYETAIENSNKAIEDENASISDLEKSLKDLKSVQSNLAVGTEEFEAVTEQIKKFENGLNGIKKEGKSVADAFAESAEEVEKSTLDVFKGIGDGLVSVLKNEGFGKLKEGLSGVGDSVLLATGGVAGIASAAGGALVDLANEALEATKEMNELRSTVTSLGVASGEIDSVTAASKALADQSGQDAGEIAKSANRIAEAYGISVTEALDQLKSGIATAPAGAEAFLASIQEFAPSIANAGIAVEDFGNLAAAALNEGLDPEKFAESFNEATIKIKDEGDATAAALNEAFGSQFGSDLIAQVQSGEKTVAEAFKAVTEEGAKFGEGSIQARKALVAIAGSFGEEAGSLEQFNKALGAVTGGTLKLTAEQEAAKQANLENIRINEAFANSLNEVSKIVAGPSKSFEQFGTIAKTFVIDLFLRLVEVGKSVFKSLEPLQNAFSKLGEAFGITGTSGEALSVVLDVVSTALTVAVQPVKFVAEAIGTLANFIADGIKKFEELTGAISSGKEIISGVANSITSLFGDEKEVEKKAASVSKNVKRISEDTVKADQAARDAAAAAAASAEKQKAAAADAQKSQEEYLASVKALREKARQSDISNTNDRIKQIEFAQNEETKALKAQIGFRGLNEKEKNAIITEINRKYGAEKISLLNEQAAAELAEDKKNLEKQKAQELNNIRLTAGEREQIEIKFQERERILREEDLKNRKEIFDKQVEQNLLTKEQISAQNAAFESEQIALATESAAAQREAIQREFEKQKTDAQINFDSRNAALENEKSRRLQNANLTAAEIENIESETQQKLIENQKAYLQTQQDLNKQAAEQGLISQEEFGAEQIRIETETNAVLLSETENLRNKQQKAFEERKAALEKTIGGNNIQDVIKRRDAINELYDTEIARARGNAEEIARLTKEKADAQKQNFVGTAETIADTFSQLSQSTNELWDALDARAQEAIDDELKGLQETAAAREKNLEDLKAQESEATGKKKAELRKQIKAEQDAAEQDKQLTAELEQEKLDIEEQGKIRKKVTAIAEAGINTALAIIKSFTVDPTGVLAAITGALAAIQIATIIATPLASGGDLEKLAEQASPKEFKIFKAAYGMVVSGPSHSQGGVPARTKSGQILELEGDEIVLTKGVKRSPELYNIASLINYAAGGVNFASAAVSKTVFEEGGVVPDVSGGVSSAAATAAAAVGESVGVQVGVQLQNLPSPVVSVQEISSVGQRVSVLERNRSL